MNVLVVDDSLVITERLEAMLHELPHVGRVLVSTAYEDALEKIDGFQPELILLDIHLPQRSGIELLGYTRQKYPNIRVIMVTNKVSHYYRELCRSCGAHGFIDKSKEFETIPGIIESYASV